MNKKLRTVFSAIFLASGVGILILFTSLFYIESEYVKALGTSYAQGANPLNFSKYIAASLSGGYLTLVPSWVTYTGAIGSLFMIYLSSFFIIHRDKKSVSKVLFSKGYFFSFQPKIKYSEDS